VSNIIDRIDERTSVSSGAAMPRQSTHTPAAGIVTLALLDRTLSRTPWNPTRVSRERATARTNAACTIGSRDLPHVAFEDDAEWTDGRRGMLTEVYGA